MKKNGENLLLKVNAIYDEDFNEIQSCPHPKQKLFIDLGIKLEKYDIIRKRAL